MSRPTKACVNEAISVPKLRAQAKDQKEFDKHLDSLINLYTPQPEIEYPDGKKKLNS